MAVYLMANKNSDRTNVSMEEIREFITEVTEVDEAIKRARAELSQALDGDDKLEELKDAAKAARDALKSYVETHPVYKEYTAKIDQLKEDKKDLIADAKTNGIPKKEIDIAIKALKQDISLEDSTEIYTNIADLIE